MTEPLSQSSQSDSAAIKTVTFRPAFDRRDPDPSKNYGIHGVEIRWLYKAALGATQFLLYTGWQLPHVERDMEENWPRDRIGFRITRPSPADLGYHSPAPQYEGQSAMECDVLPGGKCFYDGSGLNAEPVFECLVREGGDAVWRELENYYAELFLADPVEISG